MTVAQALQGVVDSAWTIAPELVMMAVAAFLVLLGSFLPLGSPGERRAAGRLSSTIAGLTFLLPLIWLAGWTPDSTSEALATAAFIRDPLARVIQPASLLAGLGVLILMRHRLNQKYPAEHLSCLIFVIAGLNLVASANDLIALFVSLELVSIPTYILLYLSRPDAKALEATIKYFLLSVFSSAFLLYGLSFLLGSAGSTNLAVLGQSLREPMGFVSVGMLQVSLVLVVAGLGFRIASVPFHFYAPDVFQGTTMPAAALLAVIPKIAGFVAMLRLVWSLLLTGELHSDFASLAGYGGGILAGMAFLTMTVGNVLALLQTNIRRLLAYSSVAHAGYMLVGLAVPAGNQTPNGAQAVLFYLLVYSIMTLGAFGVLLVLQKQDRSIDLVSDVDGLASSHPLAAMLLAVFMFGLTGLPPTAGFWGKFNLFVVAWGTRSLMMQLLAIGLAVNAAIAAWYYLRLVKCAYLNPPAADVSAIPGREARALYGAMSVCAAGAIGLFLFPNVLWSLLTDLGQR
jgi:NADH-quinone oxidoreductase subunit N